MSEIELRREGEIAYREARPAAETADSVLLVHGFPETSLMWEGVMGTIAAGGRRAIAPDFPGWGDSPPDPPDTWERRVEALDRLYHRLALERLVLVVHDWGGLVGLRWACERHPEAVAAMVLSNTGFFPDGEWHGMAQALSTPEQGEQVVEAITREMLAAALRHSNPGFDDETIDVYWQSLGSEHGRRGALELYRSGDFAKIGPHVETLNSLEVPALILWGELDDYAPVAGAYRFAGELHDPRGPVVIEGAGHFIYDEHPERCAEELGRFLDEIRDGG